MMLIANALVTVEVSLRGSKRPFHRSTARFRCSSAGSSSIGPKSPSNRRSSSGTPCNAASSAFRGTVVLLHKLGMEDASLFDTMMHRLRTTCKHYTGFPKDLGPSKVINFTSEREFVELLHQGHPVVVAFTIKCNLTKHLDKVLQEAAAEFYPHIKFMRVECPKYPGFCISRQKNEYPFVEIFHSPELAANQGNVVDPTATKYSVKVLPFNYDPSAYGFREFFKHHGIQSSGPK